MVDQPCQVHYELREVEEGTEFTLTDIGVLPGSKPEKHMTQGGQFIVDNFKAVVETGGLFAL